ncbi:MAG: DUF3592 domain-containing protein [Anaerolineae bacterium]
MTINTVASNAARSDAAKRRIAGIAAPLIVMMIGISMISGFVINVRNYLEFEKIAVITQGEVTGLERQTHRVTRNGRTTTSYVWAPVVSFIDQNNHHVSFRSGYASNPPAYQSGDLVELMYDPRTPERAEIRSLANPFTNIFTIILAVVGLLVALFGVGLFRALNTPAAKPMPTAFPSVPEAASPISSI